MTVYEHLFYNLLDEESYAINLMEYEKEFGCIILSKCVPIMKNDIVVGDFLLSNNNILFKVLTVANDFSWFTLNVDNKELAIFYDRDENDNLIYISPCLNKKFFRKITLKEIFKAVVYMKESNKDYRVINSISHNQDEYYMGVKISSSGGPEIVNVEIKAEDQENCKAIKSQVSIRVPVKKINYFVLFITCCMVD